MLHLSPRCTELKFRKLARHLRRLNLNLRAQLPAHAVLQFDEFETFEARRGVRPLSVPFLIERHTRFVIWAESATIRPHGRTSERRRLAIEEDERRFGPRRDRSPRGIRRTLGRANPMLNAGLPVQLETDEKFSYPNHAQVVFAGRPILHSRTNSKVPRRTWNPLFAINHSEAMLRDLTGRLRRRSWLASKKRRYLDLGLHVWISFRNLVRRRFNFDECSPAQLAGFADRRFSFGELVTWRQDWGPSSIHPLSRSGKRAVSRIRG